MTELLNSNDASLRINLELIAKRIVSANNLNKLFDIFKFIKSFDLKFKNEQSVKDYMNVYFYTFAFLFLSGFVFLFQDLLSSRGIKCYFFCMFAFGLLGIIYSWPLAKQFLSGKQISDLITLKKVALDNNLEFDKSDKKELMQSCENKFFVFQQGNYSREIKRYIKGEYKSTFIYHYFNLHYVNSHTSTSTDANGNKTFSTTYSDHYLYGIMIPFNIKHLIKISNYDLDWKFKKFSKWKTSSIGFNKKFQVYTDNEQTVAMFLQPKVIEQIEELYKTFPKLDIELLPQGLLALSTPDEELLNCTRKYGVDQLDLFENEIKQTLDQSKFYKALEFVNFLKEYHELN